jgi:hypothetical protein
MIQGRPGWAYWAELGEFKIAKIIATNPEATRRHQRNGPIDIGGSQREK